jgi:hypothetical protein
MTIETIRWTKAEMIDATVEFWFDSRFERADCKVIRSTDNRGEPCLIVLHVPSGRTSDESGNDGRWHPDGTAYAL